MAALNPLYANSLSVVESGEDYAFACLGRELVHEWKRKLLQVLLWHIPR